MRPQGSWPTPRSWSNWPGPSGGSPSKVAAPPGRPPAARPTCRATRDYLACAKLALAAFGVTQFFFEGVRVSGAWWPDLRERGIETPVLPGILPVTSLSTMGRLGGMGAAAPAWMEERLRAADQRGGADAVRKEGVVLATDLCAQLLESGVPGLHFYTFNTSKRDARDLRGAGVGAQTATPDPAARAALLAGRRSKRAQTTRTSPSTGRNKSRVRRRWLSKPSSAAVRPHSQTTTTRSTVGGKKRRPRGGSRGAAPRATRSFDDLVRRAGEPGRNVAQRMSSLVEYSWPSARLETPVIHEGRAWATMSAAVVASPPLPDGAVEPFGAGSARSPRVVATMTRSPLSARTAARLTAT